MRGRQVSLRDTGLRSVIPSYKSPARRCSRDRCAILNAAPYQQAIPATTVEDDDLVTTTVQLPPLTEVSPSFAIKFMGYQNQFRNL